MKRYQLKIDKQIRHDIEQLPGHLRQRVKRILQDLRDNPRPSIAEELHAKLAGHYKIKLGEWRIVYLVDDNILVVIVVKIGRKSGPEFYQGIL